MPSLPVVFTLLTLFAVTPLAAQVPRAMEKPKPRTLGDGLAPRASRARAAGPRWWASASLGMGSADLSCRLCADTRDGGFQGQLAGGPLVVPGVRLGGEITSWWGGSGADNLNPSLLTFGAVATWHPRPAGRLFFSGGASFVRYRAGDGPGRLRLDVPALSIGAGYDVLTQRRLVLSPYASFLASTNGNLISGTQVVTSTSVTLLRLGATVTWR